MQWLVDPAEARRVGMLVDVPLAVPGGAVDLVLAIGVRGSTDPTDSAAELSTLLQAHRYSTGAAFAQPGSPTNNTETDRADWTSKAAPQAPATTLGSTPGGCDAQVGASALGLDPALFTPWNGATATNQGLAEAAHTALWQPTWGTFIERLGVGSGPTPLISDAQRERWRDWWQENVRGGGPLPLLRLGNQPYGMLPVTSGLDTWTPDGGDSFEPALVTVLDNARAMVGAGVAGIAHVGSADPIDTTLLEILGSAPQLLGLRVRSLGSESLVSMFSQMYGIDLSTTNQTSQQQLTESLFLQLGIDGVGVLGTVGKTTRPLGLPLVTDGADGTATSDAKYLDQLIAKSPRTVSSVLQALLEISAGREQKAVDDAAPPEQVSKLFETSAQRLGGEAQSYAQLIEPTLNGQADPGRLHAAADRLEASFGSSGPSLLASLQPVVATRTTLADIALSGEIPASLVATQAVLAFGAWLRAQARQAEFLEAAKTLVDASIDQRAIAVADTLDSASHRYDAWVTSVPSKRLGTIRAGTPTGILFGAYGWVEGLTPGASTTLPGGYVHAPSITHATTAAVLRSGYLTHNPDAAGSGALSVDLTSARVRSALHLLDGVRQGQPMGALLGYLIERALHEAQLDVYILSLRSLAPIAAGRLVDRADAQPAQAQEAIGASNVVDGVRLLDLPRTQIWDKLKDPPADNIYLDASRWPAIATNQAALEAVLDEAADAYDAVSDVLLAESVHHLVQGNTARAAATMSAAAGGDAAPVEPEVVRTPTRAVGITHRITMLLDDTAPGGGGWSATTPRAQAEPRLAAWAQARLGAATEVVLQVGEGGTRITLDTAGLSALDLVLDSAGALVQDAGGHAQAVDFVLSAPTLEAHLRATVPSLGPGPLAVVSDPTWPAGTRAIGEVAVRAASLRALLGVAQPLTPGSFARPNDPPARTTDDSALTARLQPVVTALSTAAQALSDALAADPVDAEALSSAVDGLRAYGISLPRGATPGSAVLLAQAVLAEAQKRVTSATSVPTPYDAKAAQGVGEAVFGAGFLVLPTITGAADLFATVLGVIDPGTSSVRRWLRDLATVRPSTARYCETLLLGDAAGSAVGAGRSLRVAQLAPAGAMQQPSWISLPLPDGVATPDQPITSVVVDAPATYTGAEAVAGLVVDEWVEPLPRRAADGTASITTGLAVNANAPNARAPQAILLAISPDGGRWTTDRLVSTLRETRELAGLRAVTLEHQATPSPILPAIQEQSWSLQGDPTFDLRTLATTIASVDYVLPFVKETGP